MVCTIALPTTAASANFPTALNCSAVEMPKPTATGNFVCLRKRRTRAGRPRAIVDEHRSPRFAKLRTRIRWKPGRFASDAGRCWWAPPGIRLPGLASAFVSDSRETSSTGKSVINAPSTPASSARCAKLFHPIRMIGIQIGEDNQSGVGALAECLSRGPIPVSRWSRRAAPARWRAGSRDHRLPDR